MPPASPAVLVPVGVMLWVPNLERERASDVEEAAPGSLAEAGRVVGGAVVDGALPATVGVVLEGAALVFVSADAAGP
jgi:hypothetical protein